jgi:hypothetical protein
MTPKRTNALPPKKKFHKAEGEPGNGAAAASGFGEAGSNTERILSDTPSSPGAIGSAESVTDEPAVTGISVTSLALGPSGLG